MDGSKEVCLFQSWAHLDDTNRKPLVRQLVGDLLRALKLSRRAGFRYWRDTDINAGEAIGEEVAKAAGEADLVIALVSNNFLASTFIATQEVPLFAGPSAVLPVVPVLLRPVMGFDDDWEMFGLNARKFLTGGADRWGKQRSYEKLDGVGRLEFAQELARQIVNRCCGGGRYQAV